jgi:hypothetical protein
LERLRGGVSANVEHHEIVHIGLPQKSRGGDVFSFIHLNSTTPQDRSARFARSLRAVDEENSFVSKNRAVTKWWAIHRKPRNERALFRKGDSNEVCADRERESTKI